MKKIFSIILSIIILGAVEGQQVSIDHLPLYTNGTPNGYLPISSGGITYKINANLFTSGTSSGSINSVFGRTGYVIAQYGDYSQFFPATQRFLDSIAAIRSLTYAVTSVFGRTGAINGQAVDYAAFYPSISRFLDSISAIRAAGYLKGELDPIFLASPAYGITNPGISHWNTAYDNRVIAASFVGDSVKTLVLTLGNGNVIPATFFDRGGTGSASPGIYSLNGLTNFTQTFANGNAGTAPEFNSASGMHTLNIPFAHTSGVTAGLISKTEYDFLNAKLNTSDTAAMLLDLVHNQRFLDSLASVNSKLAGKQPALGFTPENVSNKTATASNSTITYPNWLGIQNYAYPLTGNPSDFLTNSSITGKLNIIDTATMLATYVYTQRFLDSISSIRASIPSLNGKLNILDTALMLSDYVHRQIFYDSLNSIHLTTNINTYNIAANAAAISGSGFLKASSTAIDAFKGGDVSDSLFSLPTGINEFDILYVNNIYHLFYDDKNQTKHRSAPSLDLLKTAPDDLTVSGHYPAAYYEDSTWHLYLWDFATFKTYHYTSSSASGAYALSDNLPDSLADISIYNKGEYYYAPYKSLRAIDKYKIGVLKASALSGPWTDLGDVLTTVLPFYANEEADPSIFDYNNKTFMTFSAWDNNQQRISMVQLDSNMKAIDAAQIILSPNLPWQQVNGQKIFNPVFLTIIDTLGRHDRLFYSVNPSDSIRAAWGFISLNDVLAKSSFVLTTLPAESPTYSRNTGILNIPPLDSNYLKKSFGNPGSILFRGINGINQSNNLFFDSASSYFNVGGYINSTAGFAIGGNAKIISGGIYSNATGFNIYNSIGSASLFFVDNAGNIGVGTNFPLAALHVVSTTHGIIPPKFTTAGMNAIVSPTEGEYIWNLDTKTPFFFDGTSWISH